MDSLIERMQNGPPRDIPRRMLDMDFFETTVASRFLIAYMIDDDRQRFAILWLREKPGFHSAD